MGFDWKQFAGGVASNLAADIRERRIDAREYEEEQEDLAKRNIPAYQRKKQLAASAAQFGHRARAMGASDAQIKNALSSGVNGIKEFHDKLQATVNEKGVKTLDQSDIEAIVNMPTIPDVDFKFVDDEYDKFVAKTYGIDGTTAEVEEKDPSFFRTLFALDAKDRAKRRLSDRQIFEGMSVAEINNAVNQAEYESLFPESTMTFTEVNFFGKKDLRQFTKDIESAMSTATKSVDGKARIAAAGEEALAAYNEGKSIADGTLDTEQGAALQREAEAIERGLIQSEAAEVIIENALDTYYTPDLLQNEAFQRLVVSSMGQGYLDKLLEENDLVEQLEGEDTREVGAFESIKAGMEEAEQRTQGGIFEQPEQEQPSTEDDTEETPQTETSDTEAEKEALLAKTFRKRPSGFGNLSGKGEWDRKYEGKVNPTTGKVIIAPRRPADGGEKTKEIPITVGLFDSPTGKNKKVTEAEYWDATYGETHDPISGLPLDYEKLLED